MDGMTPERRSLYRRNRKRMIAFLCIVPVLVLIVEWVVGSNTTSIVVSTLVALLCVSLIVIPSANDLRRHPEASRD